MESQKQSGNRALDYEEFRKRLPYPTVPTNLPGVFATAPFPAGFDPNTASERDLTRHGLLWRRPRQDETGVVRRAWDRAFAKPWLPENNIVPEMKVVTGRTHLRRPAPEQKGARTTYNWSGAEVEGNYNLVTSFWTVPTVSKPSEKHGAGGGWDSASWIGIGGDFNSDNLIQAGVDQAVSSGGGTHYVAWFEWVTNFHRVTLNDTTPSNYALAAIDGVYPNLGFLFLAFRGENNHLDLMVSTDNGNTFADKLTANETTSYGPALTLFDGSVFVAWSGHGNNKLNVANVTLAGAAIGLDEKVTLPWKSTGSPALASFNGILWMAWRGDGELLNIASSTDGGHTFGQLFTSNETSPQGPALIEHDGQLIIGWRGGANDVVNVAAVTTNGASATGIVLNSAVPAEASAPSLASLNGVLYLALGGGGVDYLTVTQSLNAGKQFSGAYTSLIERSPSSPALTVHNGHLFIGWRGENDHLDLTTVGIRNAEIFGFGPDPAYYYSVNIQNLAVHPGDTVVCTVLCTPDLYSGYIAFGNVTTNKHFSITLARPLPAETIGGTVEWIMEAPWDGGPTQIPKFTPVVFTDAFGCGQDGVADPLNGDPIALITMANAELAVGTLGQDTVTIDFTG
jgi:hypothetical protein